MPTSESKTDFLIGSYCCPALTVIFLYDRIKLCTHISFYGLFVSVILASFEFSYGYSNIIHTDASGAASSFVSVLCRAFSKSGRQL